MKTAKTPIEARAKPGLKMVTPWEKELIDHAIKIDRERWAALYARNKWKPSKSK